jgi:hypothetical protein
VPIKSWWFADGIHILDTTAEYADLLYGRLVAVGGQPIDEVVARLAGIIPHENEAQVRQKAVNYLSSPDLLHGLGVITTAESVSLTVEHDDGRRVTQELTPVDRTTRPAWVAGSDPAVDEPLYRRNGSLAYWFEKLTDSHVLYVKYNSCRDMPDAPFADFVRQVFAAFDAEPGWKLVIDLRDNGGGNSAVFEPFLEALEARPVSRTEGHLYVIVGRRTFSSAILNAVDLRKRTAAVFVGEPTGGKPNHFGELQMFRLPNSGLTVTYSVKYFKEVDGDPDSFYPDITVEPTFADYLAGLDPVLDRVLDNRSAPSSRPPLE